MADRTVTIKKGGNYTGLNAALAGEVASYPNITSNNGSGSAGNLIFECYADAGPSENGEDTTAAVSAGWTTSATYKIKIVANSGSIASTSWSTSKYRLVASSNAQALGINPNTCKNSEVTGLQIKNTYTTSGNPSVISFITDNEASTSTCIISRCFVYGTHNFSHGIYKSAWINNLYIFNTCISAGIFGFHNNSNYNNAYLYSCSIVARNASGVAVNRGSRTVVCKNVYASGTTGFSSGISLTNCASSDASAGSSNGCISNVAYSTGNFTNVTSGSEDLSLVVGSALLNAGTDTSGESAPLNFTTDIIGTSRPQSTAWDIGAYEGTGAPAGGGAVIFTPYDEVII